MIIQFVTLKDTLHTSQGHFFSSKLLIKKIYSRGHEEALASEPVQAVHVITIFTEWDYVIRILLYSKQFKRSLEFIPSIKERGSFLSHSRSIHEFQPIASALCIPASTFITRCIRGANFITDESGGGKHGGLGGLLDGILGGLGDRKSGNTSANGKGRGDLEEGDVMRGDKGM